MYFHAGQDYIVNTRNVIGVFDLDTAGASLRTRDFFKYAEREGAIVDLCPPGSIPKSFMVSDVSGEVIYLTQLSPTALKKRTEQNIK